MLNHPMSSPMMNMMLGFLCCCNGEDCVTRVSNERNSIDVDEIFPRYFITCPFLDFSHSPGACAVPLLVVFHASKPEVIRSSTNFAFSPCSHAVPGTILVGAQIGSESQVLKAVGRTRYLQNIP